jgi:aerobic-type carbon monoxide dehydrogenase small subunit (CoxS/CutS family)
METVELRLHVNGENRTANVPPGRSLLAVLREDLGLVGAHEGCGIGMCGTCTVLVDGNPISSCLMLAVQAQDKPIVTIEGLAEGKRLHPVQQAFVAEAGFQCAFCTSGFILSTVALLKQHPDPDDETIRAYLAGNLCRCGSYVNICSAVRTAARLEKIRTGFLLIASFPGIRSPEV